MSKLVSKLSNADFSARKMVFSSKGNIRKANLGERIVIWLSGQFGRYPSFLVPYSVKTAQKVEVVLRDVDIFNTPEKEQIRENLRLWRDEFIKRANPKDEAQIQRIFASIINGTALPSDEEGTTVVVQGRPPAADPLTVESFEAVEDSTLPTLPTMAQVAAPFFPIGRSEKVEAAYRGIFAKYADEPLSGETLAQAQKELSRLGFLNLVAIYGKEAVGQVFGGRCGAILNKHQILDLKQDHPVLSERVIGKLERAQQSIRARARAREEAEEARIAELRDKMVGEFSEKVVGQVAASNSLSEGEFRDCCGAILTRMRGEGVNEAEDRARAGDYLHSTSFTDAFRAEQRGASSVAVVNNAIEAKLVVSTPASYAYLVRQVFVPEIAEQIVQKALLAAVGNIARSEISGIDTKELGQIVQNEEGLIGFLRQFPLVNHSDAFLAQVRPLLKREVDSQAHRLANKIAS